MMKTAISPFSYLLLLMVLSAPQLAQAQANPFHGRRATPVPGTVQTPITQSRQGHTALPAKMDALPARLHSPQARPLFPTRPEGIPVHLRTPDRSHGTRAFASGAEAEAAALTHLEQVAARLGVAQPSTEFALQRHEQDALGHTHVRMQQVWQGVPVYGAEVIVHFTPQQEIRLNGRYQPTPQGLSTTPSLDADAARGLALADAGTLVPVQDIPPAWQEILDYTQAPAELVIYHPPQAPNPHLTWHISLRPNVLHHWEYFVDALTGDILHRYDHTCSVGPTTGSAADLNGVVRSLNLFQAPNGTYYLLDASKDMYTGPSNALPDNGDGFILTADLNNTNLDDPSFSDITSGSANNWAPTAVSAHHNSHLAYDYFRNTFGRSSINGQGGDVYSFINVADDNGSGLDNAFWNGAAMFYGNGDVAFGPLAGSLDVGGHEMSHGVIQETANLEYQGQSGALNESFADVFAVMIDRDDWLLGETVVNSTYYPSGALRSFVNPNQGGNNLNSPGYQPKHMNQLYTGNEDNGGVHINSGIVNHAFYLFVTGMGGNQAAKQKGEQVYYRALSQYLTRSSQFTDCRIAVIQAAEDLYGPGSSEVLAAASAFDQVGIVGDAPTTDPIDLPTNPGQDFIVSFNTDPSVQTTIQRTDANGNNAQALSTTLPQTRVSVTDDGSAGTFIGTDKHIYYISMDPSSPYETTLSTYPEWDNVAISKDGNRLAAVSTYVDTSIYVFDLNTGNGVKYRLYNPTTANGGLNAGGVLYADAITFDYSGQYVMYDAFNRLERNTGPDLEYWDVGFIRVWDNASQTFGDGTIAKLFSSLPEGVSVGNAVFSQNSPELIAFDMFDENTNYVTVMAGNIETGETADIFYQDILGVPHFSRLDDRLLFNAQEQGSLDDVVGLIALAADGISPSGNASILIDQAKWGVWYGTGARDLNLSAPHPGDLATLALYPNPAPNEVELAFELERAESVQLSLRDLQGRVLRQLPAETLIPGAHQRRLDLSDLPAGMYLLQIDAGSQRQSQRLVHY
ncbi:MAG: T9SS C-terminal target domain-containing protein [Bacteroidetes bacterium]|nr:MAG: T9SS C-terminal target domain-containing protein [Bacteroidota bacterium]